MSEKNIQASVSPEQMRPNRRKDLRKHLLVLRVSEKSSKTFFGYAKNLSKGGMFISSTSPRRVGKEYEISFKFPGDGSDTSCRCKVVWKREYNEKSSIEPGMGIMFLNLDEKTANTIDLWAEKVERMLP